jgi:hypothetical protein
LCTVSHPNEWLLKAGHLKTKPLVQPLGARVGSHDRERDSEALANGIVDDPLDD